MTRWYTTVMNQPQVVSVSGKPKLCDKMAQFDAKKFNEMSGKGDSGKKEPKKKEEKAKKPEEKPKKAEAKEEEPAAPAPVKEKDPFAALPAGNFVMDEFKRFYSNNDEDLSIKWFWEHFDHEHYSMWFCDYMYADELKMTFMSSNLIGGMMQRLDRLRKYAFGSQCVFGTNNDSSISGLWIWKGQDLAFEKSEDLQVDYASYKWTKIDSKSDEAKALVTKFFKWEGADAKGRAFCDGKIFK